jgi:hypothetical protein
MKRTNPVLDERLLDEAVRLIGEPTYSGERTYSRAVGRALEEFVPRVRARQILTLAGSGLWEASSRRRTATSRPSPGCAADEPAAAALTGSAPERRPAAGGSRRWRMALDRAGGDPLSSAAWKP